MTLRGVFNNYIINFLIRINLRSKHSNFFFEKLLVKAVFVPFFRKFLKPKMTNICLIHRGTFRPFFEVILKNKAFNFSPKCLFENSKVPFKESLSQKKNRSLHSVMKPINKYQLNKTTFINIFLH